MSIALERPADVAAPQPGLSWSAAFGGAAVASAVAIMLLALGAGIGLSAISPKTPGSNPSATTFTVLAAVWLIVVQWISSGLGGYVAGRLRPRWSGLHTDETTFRDTATGLVAWSVATILAAAVLTSGVGGIAHAVTGSGTGSAPSDYLLSTLFRPTSPATAAGDPRLLANQYLARQEASQVLANAGPEVKLAPADHDYLAQLVAARTGISADEATQRVDNVVTQERNAANVARRAASGLSLYSFFSMLVGAFIACVAASIGGRQRDML